METNQPKNIPKGIEITQRIASVAKEKFKTQIDFARAVGIAQSAISNYYKGSKVPSAENLPAIARALDVSVEWLLTGSDGDGVPVELRRLRQRTRELEQRVMQLDKALLEIANLPLKGFSSGLAAHHALTALIADLSQNLDTPGGVPTRPPGSNTKPSGGG